MQGAGLLELEISPKKTAKTAKPLRQFGESSSCSGRSALFECFFAKRAL
jgi:hypothetical protein